MLKNSLPLARQSEGIRQIVLLQINKTLTELVPLWQSESLADWKRVARPTGEGSFSINIEPYRGARSWIGFQKLIDGKECLNLLDEVIRKNQPALLGYISHPSGSRLIQSALNLTMFLCHATLQHIDSKLTIEDAIELVISELCHIFATNCATQEILTALSGLKLPVEVEQIDLGNNVFLRRLTENEISELGSNDISDESRYDVTSRYVTTAIVFRREVRVTLSELHEELKPDFSLHQENQNQIDAVLCALHILKCGRVGVVASFSKLRPTVLPGMSGQSSAPLVVNPFTFMELSQAEIELFSVLHKKLLFNKRDEVKIAATRLLDAESRLSPVDTLLDAVIGLEVLLNPNDRDELSFRVALNYAYLGSPDDRRKRFENIRDIQKTRNRVVHGGLNLQSKESALIPEHAELAKQCLRDCITRFLTDVAFAGNEKLNVDFWLDRVIPPTL